MVERQNGLTQAEKMNPQSAGSDAQAVGEPLAGVGGIVEDEFVFPDAGGVPGGVDPGPLGPAFRDPIAQPPVLPWDKAPGPIRTRTFAHSTTAYERLVVHRPTLYVPVATTATGTGHSGLFVDYLPENQPAEVGLSIGFGSIHAAVYAWTPGVWWARFNGPFGESTTYAEVPAVDRTILESILRPVEFSSDITQVTDNTLVAATQEEVVTFEQALQAQRVELQNVGANPIRYAYYNVNAAVNSGFEIAAGDTVVLEGKGLPTGRIRAFSNAGSTIQTRIIYRSLGSS